MRCDISAPQPALTLALPQGSTATSLSALPQPAQPPRLKKVQLQAGSRGAEAGRQNAACAAPLPGGRDDQQRRAQLRLWGYTDDIQPKSEEEFAATVRDLETWMSDEEMKRLRWRLPRLRCCCCCCCG